MSQRERTYHLTAELQFQLIFRPGHDEPASVSEPHRHLAHPNASIWSAGENAAWRSAACSERYEDEYRRTMSCEECPSRYCTSNPRASRWIAQVAKVWQKRWACGLAAEPVAQL